MFQLTNIINHFGVVIDESASMGSHQGSVVKVVDGLVRHLAKTSEDLNQETRLSVWAFNSRGTARCLVWDIDVLRMPSIDGMYNPKGMTALVDCTLLAVEDLQTVPQKYGDHSFVLYVITDGQENNSFNRYKLTPAYVNALPDNWTMAVFVPNQQGVQYAKTFGFPSDNISIWDTNSMTGFEDVGQVIKTTSTTLMKDRKLGIRGSKSLFKLNTVSQAEISKNLNPVSYLNYWMFPVGQDGRIDDFVTNKLGRPYKLGEAYYQLMKTETIQPQKQIAILSNGQVYVGKDARKLLGLPDDVVKVKPEEHTNYVIFVQSTSTNRKLIRGTQLLVLK